MRRKQLLTSILLLIVALVAFACQRSASVKTGTTKAAATKPLITVLNPAISSQMVDRLPLSPRLDTLEGKTIYLVDINWGGPDAAYSVFEEIQSWFGKNIPSAKIIIKRKAGMYSTDDPALWKEIAKNANAALIGISG